MRKPINFEHTKMATILLTNDKNQNKAVRDYCLIQQIKTIYEFESVEKIRAYIDECMLMGTGAPFDTIICYEDNELISTDSYFCPFNIVEIA